MQYKIQHITQVKYTLGTFLTLKAAQQHLLRLRPEQRRQFKIAPVHR